MVDLGHSIIIQMDEAICTFYHKWLDMDTKQELFTYLIMGLIGEQGNMVDVDFANLFHLTDPEC